MNTQVELLPILDDNYVFILKNASDVCLVDPGESVLGLDYLSRHKLNLRSILITHHHGDHIDGIPDLKKKFPAARVYAPLKNKNQIPAVDVFVSDQDVVETECGRFQVIALPGHTLGISAYFEAERKWLFSGDVLFGLGCGRLFEGTADMLFQSLQKISKLPSETQVFCTHEYTLTNLKFLEELIHQKKIPRTFDAARFAHYKENLLALRADHRPSVPLSLEAELQVNPFLLCVLENDLEQLRSLREARNHFRPK